ncbi:MAG: hypothetical protein WBV78_10730, partial [Roseobacter sp.]
GPKQGENLLRLSRIMYQTLRLSNDLPIGYVEDYLISEGKISSMLVRPNRRYANYYRSPYEVSYETTDFGYNPRRDYYVLPYDRSRLLMLSGIDKETIMNMAADGKADNETQ